MDQWWGGFVKWFGTINWGSAPDWVAAVGTVGALFLGLGILIHDRRRHRRELADAFSSWWELSMEASSDVPSEETYELRVTSYNAGSLPIQGAVLINVANGPVRARVRFLKETGVRDLEPIDPGERVVTTVRLDEMPDIADLFIEFYDGHGVTWHRQLEGSKYVTAKRISRLAKKNG
jgi:hypothetical protein